MELARPFLKWAGGKRQLLPRLLQRAPADYERYFEPFLGSGALFFALRPKRAVLGDANERLVRTYRAIQSDVSAVVDLLQTYPYDRDFFLELRQRDIDRAPDAELAAWMIYLNKAGFNGLYRVNSRGQFNVPFGRYANPTICDADNLRACSAALAGVELVHASFEHTVARAERGDFAYFDPPYAPLSATSFFTRYTSEGFGPQAQARLRDIALALKHRGTHVLLSNSSAPLIVELYAEGFTTQSVSARRTINSKAEQRGPIDELLMW